MSARAGSNAGDNSLCTIGDGQHTVADVADCIHDSIDGSPRARNSSTDNLSKTCDSVQMTSSNYAVHFCVRVAADGKNAHLSANFDYIT